LPAKVKIDNDGKVDRENLIEADEIEIVDKGEINQRRNSWERCGISAIIAAHVMENGSKCTEIGKTFGYNWSSPRGCWKISRHVEATT
jgi:hydroxymethylpyrimidine/phosphomethylpyrimidine kinase